MKSTSYLKEPDWTPLTQTPQVSIVIPMYNEKDSIVLCLESIQKQDYPQKCLEILVADGLSSDGSREQVLGMSSKNAQIRLLDNPDRKTPKALNIGIRNSSGEVIIILGAHATIKKDFVRQNIVHMREKGVACTGGTLTNVGQTFMQRAIGLAMGSPFGFPSAPYRFQRNERYVDTVAYAAYRRELFDEIGYFDEDLATSEDAEFNWRIRKTGYGIFFTPKIVSYYYPRKSLGSLIQQLFRYGIVRVNMIRKHKDAAKPIHLLPMMMILLSLILAGMGFLYPVFWRILFGIGASYFVLLLIATCVIGFKDGIRYIPLLPVLFVAIHLSWGLGFIVRFFAGRRQI